MCIPGGMLRVWLMLRGGSLLYVLECIPVSEISEVLF